MSSGRRQVSSHGHRSGTGARSATSASTSSRTSGGSQYVLPATTYAGSGGGHNSNGSSNPSTLTGLYNQYGRDHASTPSRRGSAQSQEVPLVHYPSDPPAPPSRQGSVDRYFKPGSAANSTGSGPSRPTSSTTRRRMEDGRNAALGGSASFAMQQGDTQLPSSNMTTFGTDTESWKARERQKRQQEAADPTRMNPVKRLIQKSKEELDRRLGRKKGGK